MDVLNVDWFTLKKKVGSSPDLPLYLRDLLPRGLIFIEFFLSVQSALFSKSMASNENVLVENTVSKLYYLQCKDRN